MFKYTSFLVFIFFFVFHVNVIYSQTIGENDIITSIEVVGLKRTKPHVAKYPLERFLGTERSAFDQNEVFAVVKNTGVLEPVSADLIENTDGLILQVVVEEKWTIFPLPFVMADSGGTSFGFFFLDLNAFGQHDMAAIGAVYGTFGWLSMAVYNHTPNRDGLPGWNGLFLYGRQDRENTDKDETIHRKYSVDQVRVSFGINYAFTELITGAFSFSFYDISIINDVDNINAPINGAAILSFGPRLSLRHSSWDGFLLSLRSLSIGYGYNYAITGSSFHQMEFRGIYEQSLIPGFRINVQSGGIWKSTSDPLFEEGPHKSQVVILPRTFSAFNYVGLSAGLEKHLYRFRLLALSAQGSWQGVFSYGPISDFEFNHGPAVGLNFYLSRLALPAIGTSLAYNMNSGLIQFSFNVGMSF